MERYLESKHLTPILAHCQGADLATREGGVYPSRTFSQPPLHSHCDHTPPQQDKNLLSNPQLPLPTSCPHGTLQATSI